jgi:hypothetical protein
MCIAVRCFNCNEKGHWRRECPTQTVEHRNKISVCTFRSTSIESSTGVEQQYTYEDFIFKYLDNLWGHLRLFTDTGIGFPVGVDFLCSYGVITPVLLYGMELLLPSSRPLEQLELFQKRGLSK